ncbi:Hypothetical protein A7982_08050 [Minicystis rosea]|nr:Hypothetical protein A7982_08050 [Minicystis rosea]
MRRAHGGFAEVTSVSFFDAPAGALFADAPAGALSADASAGALAAFTPDSNATVGAVGEHAASNVQITRARIMERR